MFVLPVAAVSTVLRATWRSAENILARDGPTGPAVRRIAGRPGDGGTTRTNARWDRILLMKLTEIGAILGYTAHCYYSYD